MASASAFVRGLLDQPEPRRARTYAPFGVLPLREDEAGVRCWRSASEPAALIEDFLSDPNEDLLLFHGVFSRRDTIA